MWQTKYQLTLSVPNIPLHRIASAAFLTMLLQLNVARRHQHNAEALYEVLLPFLSDGAPLLRAANSEAHAEIADGDFGTPQRSGTCFYRSCLVVLRYLMKASNIDKLMRKKVPRESRTDCCDGSQVVRVACFLDR